MARPAVLEQFHPAVKTWFEHSFPEPTLAQKKGWVPILAGKSALLLAPTGSGKTLAAFLVALNRLMFSAEPPKKERCRILYVSPIKALAVDVERNLRAPLAGIAATAERLGVPFRMPTMAIRSGDTAQLDRARMLRAPPDILITTPESLFLMLTSGAQEMLRSVETVIIDEIHAMVPTKRGVHLFLSLERLEELLPRQQTLQRIGLSATQRPLEEVARLLVGGETTAEGSWQQRPVEIVEAGSKKALSITVEVPVEDMSRLGETDASIPAGPASAGPPGKSIWPSIHPRLVELIKVHRSTMIFVNSRRLAERMANALNELAGQEIALAHHGSLAREQRVIIEDRLKQGSLPAIVATSSLELGLDIGAVDLVIQIEAPPSVASGMQRIGRASHQVGGVSTGVIFPKFRGDLLACATATLRMQNGQVEETFYPRNPLDVVAQQVVAMVGDGVMEVEHLFNVIRRSAPYAQLGRSSFEGVLDMLSGRYPSDAFAELRPRITWDRMAGTVASRAGSKRLAITNGGTIPDRGLYGVFLAGAEGKQSKRVGELDEEMVFESRVGEVFLLGASSWRIEDITHDRVMVTPAPGQPGKMPFWHGDRPGRPPEFGRAIGALTRQLGDMPAAKALEKLRTEHGLDAKAANNLVAYLEDQKAATGEVPNDRAIVVERFMDEMGDWRVCVLTPFGARVHAPWATAIAAHLKGLTDANVEMLYSDDGMVFRLPESESAPPTAWFLPDALEVEDLVVRSLGDTSLFASHFRENAARALLLPRRHPGKRTPLWAQRKRSADLLAVAAQFGSFPIILETYRECLKDVFDLPGLQDILQSIQSRKLRVVTVDSRTPSPFAASLLFSYVANYIYDGDAPLAERRAQALSVDQAQLKELLGAAQLRELLDPQALEELVLRLQKVDGRFPVHSEDGVHDLLLSLGDLSSPEVQRRCTPEFNAQDALLSLQAARRVVVLPVAGEPRWVAAEDTARFRDALGVMPPRGLPQAFLDPVKEPLVDLVSRYARTHGPFTLDDVAARFGLGVAPVRGALEKLLARERVLEGEFLPGGRSREWCDADVLRQLRQRSLAKLRKEVEPVEQQVLSRFMLDWQGISRPHAGLDALLTVVEQLQGAPLTASVLESEVMPARVQGYLPADLDTLCGAGEIVWRGLEPVGPHDGRIALYLVDHYPLLAPPVVPVEGPLAEKIRSVLERRGAVFFADLLKETAGFTQDVFATLWDMVWAGEVTNDTTLALRSFLNTAGAAKQDRMRARSQQFRSRRVGPPGSEGRWSLLPRQQIGGPTPTQRSMALAHVLLERYGILTREAVHAEGIPGGFSAVYDVLKGLEDSGKVRRGYFVAGLGATQFALPGADDRLRALRDAPNEVRTHVLAATDPANVYGAALSWPEREGVRCQRSAGAQVVLHDGVLLAYSRRAEKNVVTFLPQDEPARTNAAEAVVEALSSMVDDGKRRALLITQVDGAPVESSPLGSLLSGAGFQAGYKGFMKRGVATHLRQPGH